MQLDLSELKARYAGMSEQEFAALRRDDVVEAARGCYDEEVARRSRVEASGSDEPHVTQSSPRVQRQGLKSDLAACLAIALLFAQGFSFMVSVPLAMILWLINCALAWKVARDRARNGGLWACLSLVLGPLGPLIVLSLPAGTPDSFVTGLTSRDTEVPVPVAGQTPSTVARVALAAITTLLIFGIMRILTSPPTPSRSGGVGSGEQPDARGSEVDPKAKQTLDALKEELEKERREVEKHKQNKSASETPGR